MAGLRYRILLILEYINVLSLMPTCPRTESNGLNGNVSRYKHVASNGRKAHLNKTITVARMPLIFCIFEIDVY